MTRNSKIYLPRTKTKVFSVISSREGVVIPLVNFGYPNIHLTIFLKELSKEPFLAHLNAHLTHEKNKLKLKEYSLLIDEEGRKNFQRKMEECQLQLVALVRKSSRKVRLNEKYLFCSDCAHKGGKFNPSTKEEAKRMYKHLEELFGNHIKNLVGRQCNDLSHKMYFHLRTKKMYVKRHDDFYAYHKDFFRELGKIFDERFKEMFLIMRSIEKELKEILKGMKSKNVIP
jgi:hypothetical protein